MNCCRKSKGFSLIDLIIAVAIVGIISAIAIPMYSGYVQSSRENVAQQNLQQLAMALDNYHAERNTYAFGVYDPANGTDTLDIATLGWAPNMDGEKFVYTVSQCADGSAPSTCCELKVDGFEGKVSVTMTRRR